MTLQGGRCRLLELPPEIRNHIYHFVFEDLAPTTEIDVFKANSYHPGSAIVVTCHQIHRETIDPQQTAVEAFHSSHSFYIQVYRDMVWMVKTESIKHLLRRASASAEPLVRCLDIKHHDPSDQMARTERLQINGTPSDGGRIERTLMFRGGKDAEIYSDVQDYLPSDGFSLPTRLDHAPRCLNLETFIRWVAVGSNVGKLPAKEEWNELAERL